ncbi:tyrosine-type recombinase/integrase [Acinetobacter baumannii]|uniref:Site-specific recombinase, phage integrase family n=6 Tax=Acinetobacter baumannii TaxID=470 RepID=A0A0J0ZQ45_ACIBA|nr:MULTISPECIES: tyrosine-type recombinase/integrase [Acinetobacter]ALJ87135.1 putative phage integrase [Acinetobacter baumannii]EGJ59606.1 site-specific recombinase, phage integrase family [Acinetobacter baumannii 6013150]EGJ63592.1 site-specific recombinase, phage integrase family [Acinetobacter baumannii 6013113]EHU1267469.1 tyrosine-type recombinase/integrase [Acinetobacter baumannii]EHU1294523.1 tyrosine-type recombinase/integrase [Acinetobacter baumannii]
MKRSAIKKRPLSDTTLLNLEPENKDYRERDSNSLYFLVQKTGKKSWQLRYKNENGNWTWMGLGAYPEVSGALARRKANEQLEKIARGESIETKSILKSKQQKVANQKFSILINEWLNTKKANWGTPTFDKAKKSIERHIIPVFGDRDFTSISPIEWFTFFQGLQRNLNIHTQVEKLTSYCRNTYDWAKFQGRVNSNPLEGITKHLDKSVNGNMKFIELDELPTLVRSVRNYPKRNLAIGLELFILLFPRPVELRFATWDQFDLEKAIWLKPAEIMKKGIAHAVPLPKQAIVLLKELQLYKTESNLLFPSRGSLTKPISDNTFNMALNRMGYKGRQNPHGFRHIASTALNNRFSDKAQVIEACLAHIKKGVKGVYDKAAHFEERRVVMQWWADEIDQLSLGHKIT